MPFEMDDEFVRHALGAVTVPETLLKSASAASKRVDIRTLKKKKRAKEAERTRIRGAIQYTLKCHENCHKNHP